ncbi:MAG: ABC transporter substrate-binding protein, partial [Actinomycetaceae bacterium]|nr:ABC transporter substrate-binding protein [Actinomycetaceae bacterium]
RATAAKTLEKTLALYTGAEVFGSQNADTWEAMSAFEAENGIVETQVPAAEAYVDLTEIVPV